MLLFSSGCYLPILNGPPGTIGAQRTRAVLFDPFPSETMGPSIGGGRPRGFDLPLSDTTTSQSFPAARRNRSVAPANYNYQLPLQPPAPQYFPPQ